jgi:hypothetical protein
MKLWKIKVLLNKIQYFTKYLNTGIFQFKRIIRQPNSSYADQVSRIDGLVQKMDPERQVGQST